MADKETASKPARVNRSPVGSGKPGPGRPKGSPNKVTTAVREALLQSFHDLGGVEYLKQLARTEPKAYATLLGKCIPTAVEGSIQGGLVLHVVTGVPRDAIEADPAES